MSKKRDYAALAELPCIACLVSKLVTMDDHGPVELHHIRTGGGMGLKTNIIIPLCHTHHRTGGFGVAIHWGKKSFEAKYGTELELAKMVDTIS